MFDVFRRVQAHRILTSILLLNCVACNSESTSSSSQANHSPSALQAAKPTVETTTAAANDESSIESVPAVEAPPTDISPHLQVINEELNANESYALAQADVDELQAAGALQAGDSEFLKSFAKK